MKNSGINPKKKIFFLSGGSLVGQNLLASLQDRRDSLTLIALNSIPSEPSLFMYDKVYLVPSLVKKRDGFLQNLFKILEIEKPDLIIPCRDMDVFFLAELVEKYPEFLSKAIVGPKNIAYLMLDKNLSYQFSVDNNLPFVPTIRADSSQDALELFIRENGFPLLIKPVEGFASIGVRIITNISQLKMFLGKEDIIIQRYLGNPKTVSQYLNEFKEYGLPLFHSFEETKVSIQGCVSTNSEVLSTFVTYHIMKNGVSSKVEKCLDEELNNLAALWVNCIAKCGWKGPINIQSQYDSNGDLFIYEYNGRFTGATSARVYLGMDEVGIIFNEWLGPCISSIFPQEENKLVLRAPVSRLLETKHISDLQKNLFWDKTNYGK